MNLGGQPNVSIIFRSPSRLTVSKALVGSTKAMYRFTWSRILALFAATFVIHVLASWDLGLFFILIRF